MRILKTWLMLVGAVSIVLTCIGFVALIAKIAEHFFGTAGLLISLLLMFLLFIAVLAEGDD